MLNWAGNIQYAADIVDEPASVEEVQRLVKHGSRLKALGTRHAFNGIGDSVRLLVMTRLNRVVALDAARHRVTVEGGITYGELCRHLGEQGFALHNLASLPHVSIAGACATATHGSGISNRNLAAAVVGLELVTADGSLVTLSEDSDRERLHGAVVNLGALGVVTKVALAIEPAYSMRQEVFEGLPLRQLTAQFDAVMSAGYSVSVFTDWQDSRVNQVWVKSRLDQGPRLDLERHGARRATRNLHPITGTSPVHCTEQMGVPGPWFERLPHFRMDQTPSSGQELQAEYFVPQPHAVEAILAVARLGPVIGPHLLVSEIRAIASDELWLSPCYRQACVAIHFTWKPDWPAVRPLLTIIENRLAQFAARPHWGKQFTMSPAAGAAAYPKLAAFRDLMRGYDPDGKFSNEFVDTYIAGV